MKCDVAEGVVGGDAVSSVLFFAQRVLRGQTMNIDFFDGSEVKIRRARTSRKTINIF